MNTITAMNVTLVLCALCAVANYRFFKLPMAIGVMLSALLVSLGMLALNWLFPGSLEPVAVYIDSLPFDETVLHGMLSFLLFAGALQVNIQDLRAQKFPVFILAIFGTLGSIALIGFTGYFLLQLAHINIPLIYVLLFGALIAPTDPVAVLSILRQAGVNKANETKVVGESLFNDGIGVVAFLALLEIAQGEAASGAGIAMVFATEVVGGVLVGLLAGAATHWILKQTDHYQVEILLTLGLVAGAYELCWWLHLSGPIAMVISGLLIGNHGREFAMSETTRRHLDQFWELLDEILNVVLFTLIGFEMLVLDFSYHALIIGGAAIILVLSARLISVAVPISLMKNFISFPPKTIRLLTWGGLRGGISIALALSIPKGEISELILVVTYCVVVFSILVQGTTVSAMVREEELVKA